MDSEPRLQPPAPHWMRPYYLMGCLANFCASHGSQLGCCLLQEALSSGELVLPSSGLLLNPAAAQQTSCTLLCVLFLSVWPSVLSMCLVQDSVPSA